MKKIILILLTSSFLFASNFIFNPAVDKFSVLFEYCTPMFSTRGGGTNLGNNSEEQAICKEFLDEAIKFYEKQCNNNDIESCRNLSNIFYVGDGDFLPKKDIEKAYLYDKKMCELQDGKGCNDVGDYFSEKSTNKKR
ncbi:sel1 repeat family protein [Campylobacter sp. FMV-PI01]|uniref:Sel1 repeat family protein n=1 Tax=Campylobacter portucalensis TaxID=2608384 RepID=A0A6L5WHK2_9BACT|nr:sel1 repeat family protein [Campylobacter portucalensis]MSN95687.1 sel1 repeat family protein [Campylobacter portucalensis]